MINKSTFLIILVCFLVKIFGYTQSFNADFVRYLNEDGVTFKDYLKVDSRRLQSWHFIEKGKNPEEVFSFISPPNYKLIPQLTEDYNQILFNAGSFSLIREDSLRSELIFKDGLYTFQNDYKANTEGFFGCFAQPDGFKFMNYVWVFPDDFEIVSYDCNREGQWRVVNNTLSFIATELNNVLFQISYKRKEILPMSLSNRNVTLKDSIVVRSRDITIRIWDDSKIDNDIISVKLNDDWIIQYFEAKQEKISFKYHLSKPENFLILRADNIGIIPPNTTAVEIDDGKTKRTFVLNSDLGSSEAIRIRANTN